MLNIFNKQGKLKPTITSIKPLLNGVYDVMIYDGQERFSYEKYLDEYNIANAIWIF